MKTMQRSMICGCVLAMAAGAAFAGVYGDAIDNFRHAGQSADFFSHSYGYAVFPTIAKGGLGVGAAHGKGHLYRHGAYIGDTAVTQVSFGFQAGGQAYSEIIFFKDADSFDQFTSGKYTLGADVSAVAITASAGASAGTQGASAVASGADDEAATAGGYHHGVAVFTVAKGGAMYEAAVAGQRFSYKPIRVASE
jgi:lipid-binding SYLF domain-containing protein